MIKESFEVSTCEVSTAQMQIHLAYRRALFYLSRWPEACYLSADGAALCPRCLDD